MFTGIITHQGIVENIVPSGDWRVRIHARGITRALEIGASISCSGACMTVIEKGKDHFSVQVSKESLARTTLKDWKKDTHVNLERALKMGDELGGHLVTGHVDGVAGLISRRQQGESWNCRFKAPHELSRYIAAKGSVTLDGVSLTVNTVSGDDFTVNIIPHTLAVTTLGALRAGDEVNLEIDLIARYLERFAHGSTP